MYADVSEPIESSETSAYINTLMPGTYPKEKKLQEDYCFRDYGSVRAEGPTCEKNLLPPSLGKFSVFRLVAVTLTGHRSCSTANSVRIVGGCGHAAAGLH